MSNLNFLSKSNLVSAILAGSLLMLTGPMAFAWGDWSEDDYQEERQLNMPLTKESKTLKVDAGAGFLKVIGSDIDEVRVSAEIILEDRGDDSKADNLSYLEDNMRLSLKDRGDVIRLYSGFKEGVWGWSNSARLINLTIEVPKKLNLIIEDGSGSITVSSISGNLDINDGSGSITVNDVAGMMEIEDGSGSINATNIGKGAKIDDGSGSVTLQSVVGDVMIEDGSGSINVSAVDGSVVIDDGSGGINVKDVTGNFTLVDDGSGRLNVVEVAGTVSLND